MSHVMVDIETLGTRPDAAILQIGAVAFEPVFGGKIKNGEAFSQYVMLQDGMGSVDHGTFQFWMDQSSKSHMVEGLKDAKPVAEVLEAFVRWPEISLGMSWASVTGVWAKSPDFDLAILKSALSKFGIREPWNYNATRDVRTLAWLKGGLPDIDWTGFRSHHALGDAIGQCMQVQKMMGS